MKPLNQSFYIGGTVQQPRYMITHKIAEGGMGIIFKGKKNDQLQSDVAIKAIKAFEGDNLDATEVERFTREAKTLAMLNHPNIVKVHEILSGQMGAVPTWFYVMDFLDGYTPLNDHVRASGPLSLEDAVTLVKQQGGALQHAHDNKVIHRDLKPENIMVRPDELSTTIGDTKLTDFGLVKKLKDPSRTRADSLTGTGELLGTAKYMPPEQIDDASTVDHRADVYSFAATLYSALAGTEHLPFTSVQVSDLIKIQDYKDGKIKMIPLSELRPDLPKKLDVVFKTGLHPDPSQRHSTIRLFMNGFLQHAGALAQSPKRKRSSRIRQAQERQGLSLWQKIGLYIGVPLALAGGLVYNLASDSGNTKLPEKPEIRDTEKTEKTVKTQKKTDKEPKGHVRVNIQGSYDSARLHETELINGFRVAKRTGKPVKENKVFQRNIGRYILKVKKGTQIVHVPVDVTENKETEPLEAKCFTPEIDPNDYGVFGARVRYFSDTDDSGNDASFYAVRLTVGDLCNFLATNRRFVGRTRSGRVGMSNEGKIRLPADEQGNPYFKIDPNGSLDNPESLFKPRPGLRLADNDLSKIPLSMWKMGNFGDLLNDYGRAGKNLRQKLIAAGMPKTYIVKAPSKKQLRRIFDIGDSKIPQPIVNYWRELRSRGYEAAQLPSGDIVTHTGEPIDGGTKWILRDGKGPQGTREHYFVGGFDISREPGKKFVVVKRYNPDQRVRTVNKDDDGNAIGYMAVIQKE